MKSKVSPLSYLFVLLHFLLLVLLAATSKEEFAVLELSRKFHKLFQAQVVALVTEKTCLFKAKLEIFVLQKVILFFAINTGLIFPSGEVIHSCYVLVQMAEGILEFVYV